MIQHIWRMREVGWKLACAWCLAAIGVRGDETLLLDFDSHSVSNGWSHAGPIEFSVEPIPAAEIGPGPRPGGKGLSVRATGPGSLFVRNDRLVPRDWSPFREISLWIYRDPAEVARDPLTILEIHVGQGNQEAAFWRRIELSHSGWEQITVPLRWFRWGNTVPQWEQTERLGVRFREPANVVLDSISVDVGEPRSAYLGREELARLAFGESRLQPEPGNSANTDPPPWVEAENDHVSILSNAPSLDAAQLAGHLESVAAAIRQDFPFLDPPGRKPVLLVFANQQQYREFTPRLAEQLGATAIRPDSGGYTLHGISTSSWDPRHGTLRPVYTHEYLHGYIAHAARLANRGEWVHEGLATFYQLRFHPQVDVAKIVRDGIAGEEFRLPLEQLCNGQPIPMNRYWQAMTVVELLATDRAYKSRLADLFVAFRESGSTDLGPQLKPLWNTTWSDLTTRWEAHCRAKYK